MSSKARTLLQKRRGDSVRWIACAGALLGCSHERESRSAGAGAFDRNPGVVIQQGYGGGSDSGALLDPETACGRLSGGSAGTRGSGGMGGEGGDARKPGGGGITQSGPTRIHHIQGAAHLSPLDGWPVARVPGIVTERTSRGFYLQDPEPDADPATSEGIFVFTSTSPNVSIGDSVLVSGTVSEFRPRCFNCSPSSSAFSNLTTTEIVSPSELIVLSSESVLPPAQVLGTGGRTPPTRVIDDEWTSSVEDPATPFDPDSDGIDFYESLEGMRVELVGAVTTGPTNRFGELSVVVGGGAGATGLNARGGITISSGDFNPERMILDDGPRHKTLPLDTGAAFAGSIFAVVDYSFGNYKFLLTAPLPALSATGVTRETVSLPAAQANQLSVATFNVENLDPNDPPDKFARLAELLVHHLGAPDLVALEEVQDDSGPVNDGTVAATRTFELLTDAILAAAGPAYEVRSVDPENLADGGEPGGNIRVAFLFRSDRGLQFIDEPGASFDTPNAVSNQGGAPTLLFSPGRIDPENAAFNRSRKPLAGEFSFNQKKLFVVANHFNSKGGDQPLFGRFQPPATNSEAQRLAQATVVAEFVREVIVIDPQANVIVLGDLNDFQFSPPIGVLKAAGLATLVETLPAEEQYSYVFDGNSQVLDHIMVSGSLVASLAGFDVVHVNAEFADQASDHDPAVARFTLGELR